jgi:hypothetical protein
MNQQFAKSIIYGDTTTNKDDVLGLAPRYASKSATIQTSANIIDAGGSGTDNTSVWLVVAGQNTVTGIYPKGSQAGLKQEDLGVIDAFDASNNRFRAYAELWQWKYGLHVKDWRYVVRIANIDVSDLVGQTGTQAITAATWINKLMIRALARIPSMGMGTPFFLANRTVKEMLSIGAMDKSQNVLSASGRHQSVRHRGTGFGGGFGNGHPRRTVQVHGRSGPHLRPDPHDRSSDHLVAAGTGEISSPEGIEEMGYLDSELIFSAAQAITANGDTASTNVYDTGGANGQGAAGLTGENLWLNVSSTPRSPPAPRQRSQAVFRTPPTTRPSLTSQSALTSPPQPTLRQRRSVADPAPTDHASILARRGSRGHRHHDRWQDRCVRSNTIQLNVARPSGFTVDV